VVASKAQIYSKDLSPSSDVFYHCKISNDNKNLQIQGLRDTEILIFKKTPVFESILKNILR
jgi:hypothetical protein